MEILLVNHSLYTGGVETLMVRMANWLVRNGHGCSIILRESFPGDLCPLLDPRVKLRVTRNRWDLLAIPLLRRLIWKSWRIPAPDIIYTLEQNWAVVGLLISDLFHHRGPGMANGAYHPNQFCYEQNPSNPGRLGLFQRKLYDRHYRDAQKFFMSEETRAGHEAFFVRPLKDGWVWPLPIEVHRPSETIDPVPERIVTVGRLTKFKTYSWYLVPILTRLRNHFPNLQWHVYGSGMCQDELVTDVWKDAIREGLIVFHGPVPYAKMREAIATSTVFLGMGTAILEAAATGVPVIPTVIDDPNGVTWGFIDSLPYFSVGETVPGREPTQRVEDFLIRILGATPEYRRQVIDNGWKYVEAYSMDRLMPDFLEHTVNLRGGKLPASAKLRYLWIRSLKLLRNLSNSIKRLGKPPLRHPSGDRLIH